MQVYGTVQGLEDYAALTGRTLPVGANLDAALYMATMYIDGAYWNDFCGTAAGEDNAFPRKGQTVVPSRVVNATYEAAIQYLSDQSSLSVGGSQSSAVIKEKVDVIEVQYAAPTDGSDFLENGMPRYSLVENLLKPYLCSLPDGVGGWAFVV